MGRHGSGEDQGSSTPTLVTATPRILILDGGVSTHLEHLLQQREQREQQHESVKTGGKDASNDMIRDVPSNGLFRYRELWSSSLLVSAALRRHQQQHDAHHNNTTDIDKDLAIVRQGHLDWCHAGANILSTVTYQCHYQSELWPRVSTTHDHHVRDSSSSSTSKPLLTDDACMDDMWTIALEQVHRAMHEYQSQQQHQQSVTNTPKRSLWIAASSGCFGAALANGAEYTGDYGAYQSMDTLETFHRRKIHRILQLESDVDAIALETVPSILECKAIRNVLNNLAVHQVHTTNDNAQVVPSTIAFWVSLACRNGGELNDGSHIQDVLHSLLPINGAENQIADIEDPLVGIGLNCCDSQYLPSLVSILVKHLIDCWIHKSQTDLQAASRIPAIIVYPNSGEEWDATTSSWKEGTGCTSAADFADRLMGVIKDIEDLFQAEQIERNRLIPLPTIVVGGCCRTSPAAISELRDRIDRHLQKDTSS